MAKSKSGGKGGSTTAKVKTAVDAVGEAFTAATQAAKAVRKNVVKPAAKAVRAAGKKATASKGKGKKK